HRRPSTPRGSRERRRAVRGVCECGNAEPGARKVGVAGDGRPTTGDGLKARNPRDASLCVIGIPRATLFSVARPPSPVLYGRGFAVLPVLPDELEPPELLEPPDVRPLGE